MSVGTFFLGTMQRAWEKWNLRMFVLLSMTLQIILVFFAPFRKRSSNPIIRSIVWLAYLLADWAAAYCIGLISRSVNVRTSSFNLTTSQADLLALWAPFLLLHLGGPDSITAYAIEDNSLWLRHLFGLLLQVAAAVYVFYQTLPNNHLFVAIILMFVAGIIKFAERTASLYLANPKSFRNSMLRNPGARDAILTKEFDGQRDTPFDFQAENFYKRKPRSDENLKQEDAIRHAYHFFHSFKALAVNLIISTVERDESRWFFHFRTPYDALKVIAVELNFMYDAFYTKARATYSYAGCILRLVAAASIVTALTLFWKMNRGRLLDYDTTVTYVLMIAAISLELVGLYKLIFSDWTIANIKSKRGGRCLGLPFWSWLGLENYLPLKFTECHIGSGSLCSAANTSIFSRRWSETVPAFNLLSYCLEQRPQRIVKIKGTFAKVVGIFFWFWSFIPIMLVKGVRYTVDGFNGWLMKSPGSVMGHFTGYIIGQVTLFVSLLSEKIGLQDILDDRKYVSRNPFILDVWAVIVHELRDKSLVGDNPDTMAKIRDSRGEWVLSEVSWGDWHSRLLKYVSEVGYDQSILLWHIATEICYNTDTANDRNDLKEFSKIISDYMLYLLVKKPAMMSALARTSFVRYRDTCIATRKFFSSVRSEKKTRGGEKEDLREACRMILDEAERNRPSSGNSSKSALLNACRLAKELKLIKEDAWLVILKVWVEILSHGATHCDVESHLQSLREGGELITFVWLLMHHLGLYDLFADRLSMENPGLDTSEGE